MLAESPTMLADTGATGLTPSQKLAVVAKRYKMPGLLAMQPTEQIIYDSIDLSLLSSTGPTTFSFFANTNTKNFPFANLQQNKLNAGNVIVVQYVQLQLVTCTVVGTAPNTVSVINNIRTLEEDQSATVDAIFKPLLASQLTLVLGSSEVVKDFPLTNGYAGFNPNGKFGQKMRGGPTATVTQYGNSSIDLRSEPVILPQLEFKANLQMPQFIAGNIPTVGTQFLRLVLGGFGTIPSMSKPM
jgi:hypothetical protein